MDEYIRPNRLIGKLHVGHKLTASEEAELYWYIKYLVVLKQVKSNGGR